MSKRFNLLFLHYPTDIHPRTWICVRGKGIKLAVEKLEKEVLQMQNWSREKLSRNIAEKFHCAHGVIKRILQGNADFYPLPIILEMARLSAQEKKVLRNIRDKITYLKVNSASAKPIKAVRSMDHNLAKILGAFMADGSLSMQFVFSSSHPQRLIAVRNKLDQNDVGYSVGYLPSRKEYYVSAQADSNTLHFLERIERSIDVRIQTHYGIELTEEYKDSVDAFNKWIKEEFGIIPTGVGRKRGAWRTIFSNKILARYLICYFDVFPGPKTYTAHEPHEIRTSSLLIRKSFARGVLMFDGCVTKSHKIVFSVKSRNLWNAIKEIWEMDKLSFGESINARRDEFTLFTTEKNKKNKFFAYFEPNTQKHKLLHWLGGDLSYKPMIKSLEGLSVENLLKVIKESGVCDTQFLGRYFKRTYTTIQQYLNILEKQKKSVYREARNISMAPLVKRLKYS